MCTGWPRPPGPGPTTILTLLASSGWSVRGIGDVNQDGYDDVVVTAFSGCDRSTIHSLA